MLARDLEHLVESLLPIQTFCSNRIEGNKLTLKETEMVIKAMKTAARFKIAANLLDVVDAANHVAAWEYVKKLASRRTQDINVKHIVKLQRMLVPLRSGLKKKPHQIVRVRNAKVLLALPQEVPALIERLVQWLHTDVSTSTESDAVC
jgi:Fic family protein